MTTKSEAIRGIDKTIKEANKLWEEAEEIKNEILRSLK
jgi:hypothetical protein